MKKRMSFKHRIFTIWNWLYKHKHGVIVNCHYCNSSEVKFHKDSAYIEDDKYYSSYTCTKCGATCKNKEVWKR